MNACILALQHHAVSRYDNLDAFEAAYGDTVLDLVLPFSQFADYMGWKSNNRKKAVEAINLLENLKIRWGDVFGPENEDFNSVSVGFEAFVPKAYVENGMIYFSLTPTVRRELLNVEKNPQAKLNLLIANAAWSDKYTALLYEQCMLAISQQNYEIKFTVDELRRLFNVEYDIIDGEKVYKYSKFQEFRRYVIAKSVDNINKTDLVDFTVKAEVVGRPAKFVTFTIDKKRTADIVGRLEQNTRNQLFTALEADMLVGLVTNHFNVESIEELESYQVFYTEYCHNLFVEKLKSDGVSNAQSYFKTMLRNNEKAFAPKWNVIEQNLKDQSKQQHLQLNQKRQQLITEESKKYREQLYKDFITDVSDDELESLRAKSVAFWRKKNPNTKWFKLDSVDTSLEFHQQLNWEHPVTLGIFRSYIVDEIIDVQAPVAQRAINKRVELRLKEML